MLVAAAAAFALLRLRPAVELVDVEFDDGSAVRLRGGPEAADLLDDAHAILELVS